MFEKEVAHEIGLKGLFRIVKKDGDEVTYDTGWQDNLITDAGLKLLASSNYGVDLTRYLHLSTNNEKPSANDVTMKDLVAVSESLTADSFGGDISYSVSNISGDEYYTAINKKYKVTKGKTYTASKIYLNELAVLGAAPFSTALIKDLDGEETTISVLEKEDLYVYYEIRQYVKLEETNSTLNVTVRAQNRVFNVKTKPYEVGGWRWKIASPVISSSGANGMNGFWFGHNITTLESYPTDFTSASTTLEDFLDYNQNNATYQALPYEAENPYDRKCAIKIKTNGGNYAEGFKTFFFVNPRGVYVYEITDKNGKGIPKTSFDEFTIVFRTRVGRYV